MTNERKMQTLAGGEHVRLRWSMYLDADANRAVALALREAWVNSCDELTFRGRKGTVEITVAKNGVLSVSDDGDGIPSSDVQAAFSIVNTGSNFYNRKGNLAGAMGVGLKALTHTAEYVRVESRTKKEVATISFKYGDKEAEVAEPLKVSKNTTSKTGVSVTFKPSEKIYGDAALDIEALVEEVDEAAKFYPLITFILNLPTGKKTIRYPEGLRLKDTIAFYASDNLAISLSLKAGAIKPYGNRLLLKDGGNFFTHFKTQMTKAINDTIDFKISGSEIQAALSGYVAVYVEEPVFSNQQKSAIGNKEVNPEITLAVKDCVKQLKESPQWAKFLKDLETEVKAEEAAARAREKVKKARDKITQAGKKKVMIGDKLKDCINTGEDAWLAIAEGNSAGASLLLGRDEKTTAVFAIRGKFVNTLKNPQEKFLENEELQQVCQILGADIFEKYNSKKLKYGKVLIAVDGDVDGCNILALLVTFFYTCMPKFIQEGRLYWMQAPLYTGPNSQYIFTEEEYSKVKNRKALKRAKGLGELNPREVSEALFGEHRRWVQLKPKNWEEFSALIEDLMGKDVEVRKDYIMENVDFERISFL